MKFLRYRSGQFVERLDDIDALVALFANERGERFWLFEGSENNVKELMVHGAVHWPMIIPYEQQQIDLLQKLLSEAPIVFLDDTRRKSESLQSAQLFHGVVGEADHPIVIGEGQEHIVLQGLSSGSALDIDGIETLLLFARCGDRKLMALSGYGSQKALLVFSVVEALWGSEIRDLFEDVVLGLDRVLWHQMTEALQGVASGEIVRVEFPEPNDEEEDFTDS